MSADGVLAGQAAPAPGPKADPESLVLRGAPRPVARLRRGLILGLAAAVLSAVVALSWFAFQPPSFRSVAGDEADREPLRKPSLDALANAPSNYGDIPRLGPPLPGDLGQPILERERAGANEADARSAMADADRDRLSALEEERRAAAALAAARSSPVLAPLVQPGAGGADAATARQPADGAPASDEKLGESRIRPAPSPWTLSAGTIIPASLITGLNSDLPGPVVAQVTEPVRDSATGGKILIPQGARLIGSYDSRVAFGQQRLLVVWQRLVFPDASSVELGKMPASDVEGHAGLTGRVDAHTGRLLKGIVLSTLLGLGPAASIGSGGPLERAVAFAIQQSGTKTGEQLTGRNLDVAPTIVVGPGSPVRAIVGDDLVLQPWQG